jgi:hypothetical protein
VFGILYPYLFEISAFSERVSRAHHLPLLPVDDFSACEATMRKIITGLLASMLVICSLSFVGFWLVTKLIDRLSSRERRREEKGKDQTNQMNQLPATHCEMLDCKT